jgi:phosphoribosyl 1,2-cyclic phosphate phosphodiesterase
LRKDFDYAFAEHRYPGVPEINVHRIDHQRFMVGSIEVIPIRGMHYKLPILGFRIGDFAYLTDMNYIEDSEIEKLQGVDTLVINALRRKEHISHFTLEEALEVIARVKPRQAYLTHISHQLGKYSDLIEELAPNIAPAVDKMTIIISNFAE